MSKLLITIDAEVRIRNRGLPDAFERDVLGGKGASARGVDWVAEVLRSQGLRGVFFIDVFGSRLFGGSRYEELCTRLLKAGHDVEFHTHPDQAYDLKRRHMHEYSLEEQLGIVQDGIALLKGWTGRLPLAHRAGRYGANEDTLEALRQSGIFLDSSFFYGRADCKLPFPNRADPFESNGVWEIPVTTAAEPIEKLGLRFPRWTRHLWRNFQKLDVNCMTAKQLCDSVLEAWGQVPYIVTFLHSFSFRDASSFELDEPAIEAFEALTQLTLKHGMPVVTCAEIAEDLLTSQKVATSH